MQEWRDSAGQRSATPPSATMSAIERKPENIAGVRQNPKCRGDQNKKAEQIGEPAGDDLDVHIRTERARDKNAESLGKIGDRRKARGAWKSNTHTDMRQQRQALRFLPGIADPNGFSRHIALEKPDMKRKGIAIDFPAPVAIVRSAREKMTLGDLNRALPMEALILRTQQRRAEYQQEREKERDY